MSERPGQGPVARLFGSLANALLDLGLPTIRQWLRDRVGPSADVAQVTMDGALVHLEGVRIPIGPRGLVNHEARAPEGRAALVNHEARAPEGRAGLLVLDRASALITTRGLSHAGLPEMRLHAFTGVLGFGDPASEAFRAEVTFSASPEPEESAWIWGELAIRNATWSVREGSPASSPMQGHARLFVSSREWRLDGGRIEGEVFRGAFAGSGVFESAEHGPGDIPLVPAALSAAALSLAGGRVGPFVDALSGLAGKRLDVPSLVPLDAGLDGELSWSLEHGGRVDLRIAAAALDATVQGTVGPTGKDLSGNIGASVRPARLLRGSAAPAIALPRDEDAVRVDLAIGGALQRPEVKGTLRAAEMGFRLGQPRFVPAVVLHDLTSEIFLKDDRVVLQAFAAARSSRIALDVDAMVRDPRSARGTLRAPGIEVGFLRDVARTLGTKVLLPDDLVGAIDLTFAPAAADAKPTLSGAITAATASSSVALQPSAGAWRVAGKVSSSDLLATGLFSGAVTPVDGDVEVDVTRADGSNELRGNIASSRLALAIRGRADIPAYVLEDATGKVAVLADKLEYEALRFEAHGGRFVARGTIPFAPDARANLLELDLERGGASLAEAVARLARSDFRFAVARDEPRPADERWIPRDLEGRGRLTLGGDLALRTEVTLATPDGTALVLDLRLERGRLEGSTLAGELAAGDAVRSGFLGDGYSAGGILTVDALVVDARERGDAYLVSLSAPELAVTHPHVALTATGVIALLRVDAEGVMWNRIELDLADGAVRSSGVYHRAGQQQTRVSFSRVAVQNLPPIAGREPASFVRGLLSGTVIGRLDGRVRVAGDIILDEAAFPVIDLVRPTLARYGLRPPNEDAIRPVIAVVSGTDWGLTLRDVKIELHGATVGGSFGISRGRILDGHAEVTVDEEYLRTSKLLTLPRALTDRIVLPVHIGGPVERPRVHADIGAALGRFLKENRVSAFVTSAVEEAQLLFGRELATDPELVSEPPPREDALDAELRQALDSHFADWELLRRRVAKNR